MIKKEVEKILKYKDLKLEFYVWSFAKSITKEIQHMWTVKKKVPPPMPPHVLMNFRGFPPGCSDSVADF